MREAQKRSCAVRRAAWAMAARRSGSLEEGDGGLGHGFDVADGEEEAVGLMVRRR